jgi:eukaryotic-like serine/threonine-protein kinase
LSSENRVGEVLASKYRLEELLGSGGMGHVYRAVNTHVGRAVAIKVLRAEHAQNAQIVERFLREARAANLVRHPNVVDVLDIGKEDGGAPFIVQELLDGEDLAHLVARRGGKLPVEEVCDLLLPVIEAVAEAHAHGVVHRDIKPENVFLAKAKPPQGPTPKLLDFGISKVRAPDLRATEVGMMMGTPAYMAPEQVQGARDADPRSDVWALGVMMFELIAGRMPFDIPDAPALFVAIATRDAPSLLEIHAEVTPAISRLVGRCLRRQPDDRYPSAAELGRDLRHVLDNTEIEPTGQRSIPPGVANKIPELSFPKSDPLPQVDNVDAKGETELGYGTPEAPSLLPPTPSKTLPEAPDLAAPVPRASTTKAKASAPAAPPPAAAPPQSAPRPPARLANEEALSGVMLAGSSTSKRSAAHGMYVERPARDVTDMAPLVSLAVVGLVAILGTGLLMQLVHRSEGWAVARFLVGPSQSGVLAIQGGLALFAVLIGGNYFWRGLRHWRGDLSGGPPNAIVCAVVAAGAFFAAIELVSAAY